MREKAKSSIKFIVLMVSANPLCLEDNHQECRMGCFFSPFLLSLWLNTLRRENRILVVMPRLFITPSHYHSFY